MILFANTKQNDGFEPIEEGVHVGVIINIIDLGTQKNEIFFNEARKVLITWELPNETINIDGEERPRVKSKIYTSSLHEKGKLRVDLEAIRAKKFTYDELENGFDIFEMLGSNCQLQVEHKDSGFANIVSVMSMPKWIGGKLLATSLEKTYEISNDVIPEYIPQWAQDIIEKSKEYNMGVN
jgi:hypothetical protein